MKEIVLSWELTQEQLDILDRILGDRSPKQLIDNVTSEESQIILNLHNDLINRMPEKEQ